MWVGWYQEGRSTTNLASVSSITCDDLDGRRVSSFGKCKKRDPVRVALSFRGLPIHTKVGDSFKRRAARVSIMAKYPPLKFV